MQTRRDQLQAYRFQNRRALAALVTGEPNVVEPPMRRLTVVTVSGIMIAILVAVVFALLGQFSPDTGSSWKQAGAIIVERETGATYVIPGDGKLHPVINYASAALAVGSNQTPHVVTVDRADLKHAPRGFAIGIRGLPDSLPAKSDLVASPWTVCSTQVADPTRNQVFAHVTVRGGDDGGVTPLPSGSAVVVRSVKDGTSYLLAGGKRLAIGKGVGTALGLADTTAVPVGTAFLDGVPAGTPLRAPRVPGAGQPSHDVGNAVVGQLVQATDTKQFALVMRDGLQPVNAAVQARLLATEPLGPGGAPLPSVATTESVILDHESRTDGPALLSVQLSALPTKIGAVAAAPTRAGGVCAVYRRGSTTPGFAVPPGGAPSLASGVPTETARSSGGQADEVVLPADGAAVVRAGSAATTIFLVAAPGQKFPIAGDSVLNAFGYSGVTPVKLPQQLLPLIPDGPALSSEAVLKSRP